MKHLLLKEIRFCAFLQLLNKPKQIATHFWDTIQKSKSTISRILTSHYFEGNESHKRKEEKHLTKKKIDGHFLNLEFALFILFLDPLPISYSAMEPR